MLEVILKRIRTIFFICRQLNSAMTKKSRLHGIAILKRINVWTRYVVSYRLNSALLAKWLILVIVALLL